MEPNISLRLTGTEDLLNPLSLAVLMKSGQAPNIELIEEAKKLIASADPSGILLSAASGVQIPPQAPPVPPQQPQGPQGPPGLNGPPDPPPPEVGGANKDWSAMEKLNKRIIER